MVHIGTKPTGYQAIGDSRTQELGDVAGDKDQQVTPSTVSWRGRSLCEWGKSIILNPYFNTTAVLTTAVFGATLLGVGYELMTFHPTTDPMGSRMITAGAILLSIDFASLVGVLLYLACKRCRSGQSGSLDQV